MPVFEFLPEALRGIPAVYNVLWSNQWVLTWVIFGLRQRDKETEKPERRRDRGTVRQRNKETKRNIFKGKKRQRQIDRGTVRQRDNETERQRDKEPEGQ